MDRSSRRDRKQKELTVSRAAVGILEPFLPVNVKVSIQKSQSTEATTMVVMLKRFPCLIAVCLIAVAFGSTLAQQVRDRELVLLYSYSPAQMPIEIVSTKLKDQEFRPGEKIKGDDNWLHGLSFRIKNVSDKPLAYVEFMIEFKRANRVVGYSLHYGVDTERGERRTEQSPPAVQPGETLDLALTKENYTSFLYVLEQGEIPRDFDTASYFLAKICFENEPDLMWTGGNIRRRDPNTPYKFNTVGPYVLPAKQ
jgi:hypothetical protein